VRAQELLNELIAAFSKTGERPVANAFMRQHPDDITLIKSLVSDGYIDGRNERYAVGLAGLALLPRHDTEEVVGWIDALRVALREAYDRAADEPVAPLKLSEIAASCGLGDIPLRVALYYCYEPFGYIDGGSTDENGELRRNISLDIKILERDAPRARLDSIVQARRDEQRVGGSARVDGGSLIASGTTGTSRPQLRQFSIPGYSLHEELGNGASGRVFRAIELSPVGMERAIKVLEPHPFGRGEGPESRFASEGQSLAKLQHRAIVRYVASARTNDEHGFLYLVMELVDGEKLRDAAQTMSFEERVAAIVEILDGLQYMHSAGIFHRDVKGGNIVVRSTDRQPVLVDFGLAYLVGDENNDDRTRYSLGTPGYVPPEAQADPKASRSPKYDIFSAGVTLYEVLAGRRPNHQVYETLSNVDASLVGLDPMVQRAIASTHERFDCAAEFADTLRLWLKQERARRSLPNPSPLSARLLEKLVAEDEKRQQQGAEKEAKQRLLVQAFTLIDDIATTAAVAAFEETATMLAGRSPAMRFINAEQLAGLPGVRRPGSISPVCALEYQENVDRRIVFARSAAPTNPLGISRRNEPFLLWPQPKRHYTVADPHVFSPVWIIYQEGKNQAPSMTLRGGMAAVSPVPDPRAEGFALRLVGKPRGRREPLELDTAEKVKEYVIRAIAASMNVNLDR
jgi:serine/threonine protein kinase